MIGPSGPAAELQLVDDHGRRHANPAVVLVSNNPYSLLPPLVPGTRPTLDSGELGIIVLDRPRLVQSPGLTWSATRLEVTAPAAVDGGVDGETVALGPPLRFVIGLARSASGSPPATGRVAPGAAPVRASSRVLTVSTPSSNQRARAHQPQKHRNPPTLRSAGFDRTILLLSLQSRSGDFLTLRSVRNVCRCLVPGAIRRRLGPLRPLSRAGPQERRTVPRRSPRLQSRWRRVRRSPPNRHRLRRHQP